MGLFLRGEGVSEQHRMTHGASLFAVRGHERRLYSRACRVLMLALWFAAQAALAEPPPADAAPASAAEVRLLVGQAVMQGDDEVVQRLKSLYLAEAALQESIQQAIMTLAGQFPEFEPSARALMVALLSAGNGTE